MNKEKEVQVILLITVFMIGLTLGLLIYSIISDIKINNIMSHYKVEVTYKENANYTCIEDSNLDNIMAVFFYCNSYYNEAQEWWNKPLGQIK